jgi:tRNA nucleotidyltransferase (CCA-adding enzyme)
MPIPESQLEIWSHQGAVTASKTTHESIRIALSANTSPIRQRVAAGGVEIYLQGSYKNDTNIRGDSDVDVVVELTATYSAGGIR